VPTDDDGLDPGRPRAAGRFLYTIPTFQNPSGRRSRSSAAAPWPTAPATEGARLEDDPYSLVRYDGEPLPSVYELAEREGVVYSFSFSKIVAPGFGRLPGRRAPT
jgi:2-aminoadipate transaminase